MKMWAKHTVLKIIFLPRNSILTKKIAISNFKTKKNKMQDVNKQLTNVNMPLFNANKQLIMKTNS